jgi:GH24 family phage-related lysozyme (muramidase)
MGLRKCDRGPDVRLLQEALTQNGFTVKPTGFFDDQTDQAVRAYQTRMGLLSDGIAGPLTRDSLGIDSKGPCRVIRPKNELELLRSYQRNSLDLLRRTGVSQDPIRARNPLPSMPSRSPHGMCISQKGLRFIFTHETLPRISNHLHWPKGASGVTIGPGYDMKLRSEKTIVHDLTAIGVEKSTAEKAAKASELTEDDADRFAKKNKSLINLTTEQEMQLLILIVPGYEATVRRNIHIDLKQHEYDAFVSFAYNPGYDFKGVANLINHGRVADAMIEIGKRIKSGGKVDPSLDARRKAEITLYTKNEYGKLRG